MSGRIGGWAGVIGPSLFVVVFLVEGWLRPGYDPAADYVSALSLGERGWVQVTSFLIVGVCLLLFTVAVAGEFPDGAASRAGPILLGIIGVGLLLSGPFVMDPVGTPSAELSWHGLIHGVLGGIVFVLMAIVWLRLPQAVWTRPPLARPVAGHPRPRHDHSRRRPGVHGGHQGAGPGHPDRSLGWLTAATGPHPVHGVGPRLRGRAASIRRTR